MERDFIRFRGREYRVEVNMRVLDAYFRAVGSVSVGQEAPMYPEDLLLLLWLAIDEGARLDGVELDIKPEDLSGVRKAEYQDLTDQFTPIFKKHTEADLPETEGKKKVTETVQP